MSTPLAVKLKKNYKKVWFLIFFLCLIPALNLVFKYFYNELGINPLQKLQHSTGVWALIMLLITLSITPLRRFAASYSIWARSSYGKRLSDWNWIIRLRKMLGLYCFFYATLHLGVYVFLDLAQEWQWAISDIREKKYIVLGLTSYLLLIPLAITSYSKIMVYMGKSWRKLHRLIYVISILVIVHFIWSVKVGRTEHWIYAFLLFVLLGYRILVRFKLFNIKNDDGMEAPIRNKPFVK